jgi:predicted dehydrogenase
MPDHSIRTGLVSFGISSRTFHAPFLTTLPGYRLEAVVERSSNKAAETYPGVKTYRSTEELLSDGDIELVVITSPNETHFPYAKAALQAGKHVVVEKPFTTTSAEARELVQLAHQTGKVCSVYQNRRYTGDFLTMQEIIRKEYLGPVHTFEAHYDRFRPDPRTYGLWREEPKPGSGVLYDLGSHLIDQSLVLFGIPDYILADIRCQKPYSKVDDYFDIRLDYKGLSSFLKSGMLVREMGPRYLIHGTKGSFVKSGEDPQEERLKAGELPVGDNWCFEDKAWYGLLHTEMAGRVVRETYPTLRSHFGYFYGNLYETIRNGKSLSEKPEHGFNVVRLIELAFESSKRQCRIPVEGMMVVDG